MRAGLWRVLAAAITFSLALALVTRLWQPMHRLLGWLLVPLGQCPLPRGCHTSSERYPALYSLHSSGGSNTEWPGYGLTLAADDLIDSAKGETATAPKEALVSSRERWHAVSRRCWMDEETGEAVSAAPPWRVAAREAQRAAEAALRRRDLTPRVRERLEMVKGVALGQSLSEVARWSGRTERTVLRWLRSLAAGGIVALADAPRGGRPANATAAYRAALERAVTTSPREVGLLFDTWTSARLSAYLAKTTGVRLAPGWVRALLAQQRYRAGRPKHTLGHLQDPTARTACEHALQAAGEKVPAAADEYELHYEDETHLETNPHLTRVWHKVGCQPTLPAAGTNRRLTCFGSVEARTARTGRGVGGDPGLGRLRALSGSPGGAPCGHRADGHPGAGQRPVPHQQGQSGGAGGACHLVRGAVAGALLSQPERQRARVAHPQAGRAGAPGAVPAGVHRRDPDRPGGSGWGALRHP